MAIRPYAPSYRDRRRHVSDRPIYIAGAGRVARSFARWLPVAGFQVAGWGARRPDSIDVSHRQSIPVKDLDALSATVSNDAAVLICVSDHAIAEVAARFNPPNGVVIHVSGFHGSVVMSTVAPERRLAFHPVVAFPEDAFAPARSPFRDSVCTLEGDDPACSFGEELAAGLGATSLRLSKEQKAALHAASALLANMTVVLADAFDEIVIRHDIPDGARRQIRDSLLRSVQVNLQAAEPGGALTGPVARGDVDTVRAHLQLLGDHAPGIVDVYQILSRRALDIVRLRSEIPGEQMNDLERLLNRR